MPHEGFFLPGSPMRYRLKTRKDTPFGNWLMWLFVSVLVAGGAYQALRIRRSILHSLHRKTTPSIQSSVQVDATKGTAAHPAIGPTDGLNTPAETDPTVTLLQRHPDVLLVLAPGSITRSAKLFTLAKRQLANGNPITARNLLNRALKEVAGLGEHQAYLIRALLNRINRRTLLSSALAPGDPLCRLITVQRGQTPDYLADIYRITPAMLRVLNPQLNPRALDAGEAIKILLGPVDVTLVLHANRIDLSIRSQFIMSLPMRADAIFPPVPGRYRVTGEYYQVKQSGTINLDHIDLAPSSGATQQAFVIRCLRSQTGGVRVSSRAMRWLHAAIRRPYSRVEVVP